MTSVSIKRDQIWQHEYIRSLAAYLDSSTSSTDDFEHLEQDFLASSRNQFERDLRRVLVNLKRLRLAAGSESKLNAVINIEKQTRNLLKKNGVDEAHSRIRFLYAKLYIRLSDYYLSINQIWDAGWYRGLATRLSNGDSCVSAGEEASFLYQSGRFSEVMDTLGPELVTVPDLGERSRLASLLVICEGSIVGAQKGFELGSALIEQLAIDSSRVNADLLWHTKFWESVVDGSLQQLFVLTRRSQVCFETRFLLELRLWARCQSSRQWIGRLTSLRSLTRTHRPNDIDAEKITMIGAVESLDDSSIAIHERLMRFGRVLSRLNEIHDPKWQLLFLGASWRGLMRLHQTAMAEEVLVRYRDLARRLSAGRCDDPMLLTASLEKRPSSLAARALLVGNMSFDVAKAIGVRKSAKMIFGSESVASLSTAQRSKCIDILAENLGALRGPLQKVAQVLTGMMANPSDPESAKLRRMTRSGVAIDVNDLDGILQTELGDQWQVVLPGFEWEPIAFGSLGQVHRARLVDGTSVAVKVQYPQIESIIDQDIRLLRLISPLVRFISPRLQWSDLVSELHTMMMTECDYLNEARWQIEFGEEVAGSDVLAVPKVYPEHSTRRVLISELVEAEGGFVDFCRQADRGQREGVASSLCRYAFASLVSGKFNTDLNEDNFAYANGRLYLLDFGSVKSMPSSFSKQWRDLLEAGLCGDEAGFFEVVKQMGMVVDGRDFDVDHTLAMLRNLCMSQLASETPTPISQDLVVQEIVELFTPANPNIGSSNLRSTHLFAWRFYYGLLFLLSKLDVRVLWKQQIRESLAEQSH